ncbi:hypothetical protein GGR88_000241 [Sphingomonas jejuensis]|uniref:Uncharacterized protein n=1 Tax=Sphingomonas jejuensis TaxID=904715 RepID=A0ABX0XIS6_9SPHN|nr:hypothetical protein [Sphingomonas jejuensis]
MARAGQIQAVSPLTTSGSTTELRLSPLWRSLLTQGGRVPFPSAHEPSRLSVRVPSFPLGAGPAIAFSLLETVPVSSRRGGWTTSRISC